jgi:hypothetical protein
MKQWIFLMDLIPTGILVPKSPIHFQHNCTNMIYCIIYRLIESYLVP